MTKETRAVLRSRRGEEISLFSAISAAVRVAASTFGRAEGRVLAVPVL